MRRLLTALAVGIPLSLLIAVLCLFVAPRGEAEYGDAALQDWRWLGFHPPDWHWPTRVIGGRRVTASSTRRGIGVIEYRDTVGLLSADPTIGLDSPRFASGWPVYSLVGQSKRPFRASPAPLTLPSSLRWRGAIANGAVFSCSVFCLLVINDALRSRLGRGQNQCAQCGYSLRGLTGACPECGTASNRDR